MSWRDYLPGGDTARAAERPDRESATDSSRRKRAARHHKQARDADRAAWHAADRRLY